MGNRSPARRSALSGLAAAFLAALLSAAAVPASADGPILVGTVFNTRGGQAVLDLPASRGARLAIAQINAAGGISGRPLHWVAVEGNSVPRDLAAQTRQALDDRPGIAAFLGLSDTDNVLAAAPVAAAASKVFLTSGATSPRLPGEVPTWLFLACFGDNVQAAAAAEWAHARLGARRAMVLYDPSDTYTRLLQHYFVERFTALGGTVAGVQKVYPGAALPHLPEGERLAPGSFDLLFLGVRTAEDAARMVPLIRQAGFAGPVMGGDGYDATDIWAQHPGIGQVFFTTHAYLGADNPDPKVAAFLKAYAEAHPGQEPGAFAALGYDAVGLIAAAIDRAGSAAPRDVLKGLSGLENYRGVTGTISYPAGSRIPTKSVTILKVEAGRQAFVEQVLPTQIPKP